MIRLLPKPTEHDTTLIRHNKPNIVDGQFLDEFSTEWLTPEQRKEYALATWRRLPKCMEIER